MRATGEMPEWSNGTDSKSVVLATVPRVQIPISPPYIENPCNSMSCRGFFFSIVRSFCTTLSAVIVGICIGGRGYSTVLRTHGVRVGAGCLASLLGWAAVLSPLLRVREKPAGQEKKPYYSRPNKDSSGFARKQHASPGEPLLDANAGAMYEIQTSRCAHLPHY